jgi:hypothetical protein
MAGSKRSFEIQTEKYRSLIKRNEIWRKDIFDRLIVTQLVLISREFGRMRRYIEEFTKVYH